jgi:hypothetical protein
LGSRQGRGTGNVSVLRRERARASAGGLHRAAGNRVMSWLLSHPGGAPSSADGSGAPLTVQRQPKTPKFDQCAATGVSNINLKIENGRQRAIDFVQVAIRALGRAPTGAAVDNNYRTALKVHFGDADAAARTKIIEKSKSVLATLKAPTSIACASSPDHKERCEKKAELFGFVILGTDTIIICPNIADESITCRAIGLIHEALHIHGVGAGSTHPPYRGAPQYPTSGPMPAGESLTTRIDNPDAYAYFGAHIWRDVDSKCLPPLVLNQVIEMTGTAPPPAPPPVPAPGGQP